MTSFNRYKFTFSDKQFTVTTQHDNLFMEEIQRVAGEKYRALQEKMPTADTETLAILLAINTLSVQLARELEFDKQEEELNRLRKKALERFQAADAGGAED